MSNKQAIDIIEKMIDDFNETERRWLYLSDNETYARDVLIETKYKIQSLPDTDEWISVEEINRTLDRKKQLHTITKEEHNGKEMNLTYHAWYNLWYLEWYIAAIENILPITNK